MSLHTNKAFALALTKGAAASRNREHWTVLVHMSKRTLAELVLHLAAQTTDSYDTAIESDGAYNRVMEELDALKANGLI